MGPSKQKGGTHGDSLPLLLLWWCSRCGRLRLVVRVLPSCTVTSLLLAILLVQRVQVIEVGTKLELQVDRMQIQPT
jgi:hypothetical protein